jgi:hypothetical protein
MNELEFAHRIRQALNEGAEKLDYKAQVRLQAARRAALARHPGKPGPSQVWVPALQAEPREVRPSGVWAWVNGLGLAAPLAALIVGVAAIHQWQEERMLVEVADLDFSVLLDEAPIDAYADKAFGVVLAEGSI